MANLGISPYLANQWLNTLRNVPFTAGLTCVQMHTGHPGAGSSSVALGGSRQAAVFTAASAAGIGLTGSLPTWLVAGPYVLTHVSVWDAFAIGNLLWTTSLLIPRTVASGDVYTLNANDLDLGPLAAA